MRSGTRPRYCQPADVDGTLAASTGSGQYRIELAPMAGKPDTIALGYRSVSVTEVMNPSFSSSFITLLTGKPDPDPRSTISVPHPGSSGGKDEPPKDSGAAKYDS